MDVAVEFGTELDSEKSSSMGAPSMSPTAPEIPEFHAHDIPSTPYGEHPFQYCNYSLTMNPILGSRE